MQQRSVIIWHENQNSSRKFLPFALFYQETTAQCNAMQCIAGEVQIDVQQQQLFYRFNLNTSKNALTSDKINSGTVSRIGLICVVCAMCIVHLCNCALYIQVKTKLDRRLLWEQHKSKFWNISLFFRITLLIIFIIIIIITITIILIMIIIHPPAKSSNAKERSTLKILEFDALQSISPKLTPRSPFIKKVLKRVRQRQ